MPLVIKATKTESLRAEEVRYPAEHRDSSLHRFALSTAGRAADQSLCKSPSLRGEGASGRVVNLLHHGLIDRWIASTDTFVQCLAGHACGRMFGGRARTDWAAGVAMDPSHDKHRRSRNRRLLQSDPMASKAAARRAAPRPWGQTEFAPRTGRPGAARAWASNVVIRPDSGALAWQLHIIPGSQCFWG